MKKHLHHIYGAILLLMAVSGCSKDFFEPSYTEGPITEESIWITDRRVREYLNQGYNYLLGRYNLDGGAILASASDEAVNSNLSSVINIFNNGTWGPLRTFDDQYTNLYTGLRVANVFLQRSPTSTIYPVSDLTGLRGEAFFLRAMYHYELFKRYGQIVLATRPFVVGEDLNLPRNTVEEVVRSITTDCDSAINQIAAASTRDWDAANYGRATKAAGMALKAKTLLIYASPLYNTSNDVNRWQNAASAAKALMDLNKHGLLSAADYPNLWDYTNTATSYNKEVIFATPAGSVNTIESNNAPIGFTGGLGRTNPTQDLVDAFEMTNGKPITDPTSGYNPQAPYTGRDPRLNQFIIVNGSTFKTGSLSRPVETFEGGLDNVPTNVNNTKSGYYMRKFLSSNATYNVNTITNVRRPWVLFRYAEILLMYAEALNEVSGPTQPVYDAVNAVRVRAGMPVLPAGLSQITMRERIRNERRVEFCFEEQRFFDVRRWKLGETYFNGPIRGMKITKSGTALSYSPFVIENRVFTAKNYLYPIPQAEIDKADKLTQNPGYN
ncbi:RagB/SusD family nutrient uptake outer membrane protein [Mucilaginibacter daejeonensis]|uniref:RagB/SusD family nutrient uptake outer membrane protein n=1 Tax=Mucilaginibacter daejeonensis TaxID=398049 RepID=UPI001D175E21|nr:RagB/SusD family nutrient uptake outer membrane protein [Mucilaginibacter daejeonensis]UEG51664.1 RagB/SusD family nutrient uptake outer membrane protein [Mucilaginibacter daejeonensis]